MNVPYYNPYPQFYGQPMPDQLAQLRQGVFQPPQQQMICAVTAVMRMTRAAGWIPTKMTVNLNTAIRRICAEQGGVKLERAYI